VAQVGGLPLLRVALVASYYMAPWRSARASAPEAWEVCVTRVTHGWSVVECSIFRVHPLFRVHQLFLVLSCYF